MSKGLQLDAMHHSKTWGNHTENNKQLQNWEGEELRQVCSEKLRRGGFPTTILASPTQYYLNHDLIAFHFLFLKIHWHRTMIAC